jgi:hypothetical protein
LLYAKERKKPWRSPTSLEMNDPTCAGQSPDLEYLLLELPVRVHRGGGVEVQEGHDKYELVP